MTSNLHVSEECKKELDSHFPLKINNEKVSYDDMIQSMVWFLKNEIDFEEHDFIKMVISYKQKKLEVVA
jgi:hypothetical protein